MSSRRRKAAALAAGATVVLLAGAPEAPAATGLNYSASSNFTSISLNDATNDADVITVSVAGNTITISDTGTGGLAPVDADCTVVNATTATCPLDPPDPAPPATPTVPVQSLSVSLNNGTDSFTNQNLDAGVFEGDATDTGNKTISSGPGSDSITTGMGDDVIDTGAGFDSADGSFGNDTITTGTEGDSASGGQGIDSVDTGDGGDTVFEDGVPNGADSLNGGAGADSFGYAGASPVAISFNGQPDDGHPGEGDNAGGFEDMFGTAGSDTLSGDAGDNDIQGSRGNDLILGLGGNDTIGPGDGADNVDGGDGVDEIRGESFDSEPDSLNGGAGAGDLINYCCGPEPITIAQDGLPNDGRAAEGDNLAGFEAFATGDGPDIVTGDASANLFNGNRGNDLLVGLGGGDEFNAGPGDDVVVATEPTKAATARGQPHRRARRRTRLRPRLRHRRRGCRRHGGRRL
jgi:Ca2+-binding RTX toxin-like protein